MREGVGDTWLHWANAEDRKALAHVLQGIRIHNNNKAGQTAAGLHCHAEDCG